MLQKEANLPVVRPVGAIDSKDDVSIQSIEWSQKEEKALVWK